ncbi:MAG: hypothetical protein M3500_16735 [Actinomycetota bacterium]|nr:hypothetical protein [Actinomycetota bacterium]
MGATYTRYADDLTFSGGPEVGRRANRIVASIRRIIEEEGFLLNNGKTRVQPRDGRQTVTGIVVNDKPNVARDDYERLCATLHNAALTGAQAQNRSGHPDFRAHLLGRIAWVEALNPARGRRLRARSCRETHCSTSWLAASGRGGGASVCRLLPDVVAAAE